MMPSYQIRWESVIWCLHLYHSTGQMSRTPLFMMEPLVYDWIQPITFTWPLGHLITYSCSQNKVYNCIWYCSPSIEVYRQPQDRATIVSSNCARRTLFKVTTQWLPEWSFKTVLSTLQAKCTIQSVTMSTVKMGERGYNGYKINICICTYLFFPLEQSRSLKVHVQTFGQKCQCDNCWATRDGQITRKNVIELQIKNYFGTWNIISNYKIHGKMHWIINYVISSNFNSVISITAHPFGQHSSCVARCDNERRKHREM